MPLLERDTSKPTYGEPVFDHWRVAIDAYKTMVDFLKLTPQGATFNASDKAAMERDLQMLAQCVGQMDSDKRGKGVSFDEVPFITTRLAVACTRMVLSGALDAMAVAEDA